MKTDDIPNISPWQLVAAEEIRETMRCWGCKTLSSLHKDGVVDYTTLSKLNPERLDPTLSLHATKRLFTKLYLVAAETFTGEKLKEVQNQLSLALMRVSAADMTLTDSDRKKIAERKRIKTPPEI